MIMAQILSACRMKYYYFKANLPLNYKFSIGLYFTAMMFNNVLPGGIGGDGYKIYTIGKLAGFSRLKALQVAFSERGSGLFVLLLLLGLFGFCTNSLAIIPYKNYIITALIILLILSYATIAYFMLRESPATMLGAACYSLPIQLLNIIIALIFLFDFGITDSGEIMSYLVIFLIASVATIIPITIGGAGIRELVFLYGAELLNLNPELGIALAFLLFIINVLCGAVGLLFWHRLARLYVC
jgi:uncharacterized membrane protein YbhN (UPF0104 family)